MKRKRKKEFKWNVYHLFLGSVLIYSFFNYLYALLPTIPIYGTDYVVMWPRVGAVLIVLWIIHVWQKIDIQKRTAIEQAKQKHKGGGKMAKGKGRPRKEKKEEKKKEK